jgi:small subunit ribosomal protein S5
MSAENTLENSQEEVEVTAVQDSEAVQSNTPRKPRNERGQRNDHKEKEPNPFQEELLAVDRVTRVTAWGRQLRFRAVMLVWDGKGQVGLGTGKSWEVVDAIAKAIADAKKNMVSVKMENGTVPYNINAKFKSAKCMVHPASKGTGLIAWGSIRKVLMVAWYTDVLAKRYGSTNLINNARAAIKALSSFK